MGSLDKLLVTKGTNEVTFDHEGLARARFKVNLMPSITNN